MSVSEKLRELAKALERDKGTTAQVPDGDGNYLLAEHALEALATEIEEIAEEMWPREIPGQPPKWDGRTIERDIERWHSRLAPKPEEPRP